MKTHLKICKLKDDEIRLLELERDIEPDFPECSKECRFCNKFFSRVDNLNRHIGVCKERKEYKKIILTQPVTNTTNSYNTNSYNNTNSHNNNTFNINFYGEATDTHILEKQLKGMIRRCLNYESEYESASELTIDYCNSMYSVEENKNIDIKDQRSKYGKVITSKGKKYIAVKKIIETVLKTTAAKLHNRLNILKENKPDGFDEDMKRIYNEIKNMEEDGLMHFYTKEERKELYNNLLLIFTEKEEDDESSDDE
jgi:uncharacterized membrane-anchored protein